jgi:hypothetical protein
LRARSAASTKRRKTRRDDSATSEGSVIDTARAYLNSPARS